MSIGHFVPLQCTKNINKIKKDKKQLIVQRKIYIDFDDFVIPFFPNFLDKYVLIWSYIIFLYCFWGCKQEA